MIRRNIEDAIRLALSDTPVVLLNGVRQTGKTTLALMVAEKTGAHYFTLDDAATLALAAGDPAGFISNLSGPVVLDESPPRCPPSTGSGPALKQIVL